MKNIWFGLSLATSISCLIMIFAMARATKQIRSEVEAMRDAHLSALQNPGDTYCYQLQGFTYNLDGSYCISYWGRAKEEK